jgi:hypothetical protein
MTKLRRNRSFDAATLFDCTTISGHSLALLDDHVGASEDREEATALRPTRSLGGKQL